ncbi:hypothetical protein BV25DRAFT_1912457 [Artomyces pyxidatus]|uniref:Uncharacterized protein n=1 Tax=Artomyces pyxidatus TaxID=48021 RepID=A0ACB8TFD3_9AGAM|nr:hypothetical protein BV25DRAFT_1912457 [Artomyces pyxidatus]
MSASILLNNTVSAIPASSAIPAFTKQVPNEIILMICEVSTLETLCRIRSSNKRLRQVVDRHLRESWNTVLKQYVDEAVPFRKLLRDTRSVISGSTALHFLLRGPDAPVDWQPKDLDIYCPLTTAADVVDYLIVHEGFRVEKTMASRDRSPNVHNEYSNGAIASVITMSTPKGLKVDIIAATRNSPLLPLTHFWGTLVTNYISADTLCVSYPRLTLRRFGLLNPTRKPALRAAVCVDKYMKRGFDFTRFGLGLYPPRHTPFTMRPLHCPHTFRTFHDAGCLRIHFDEPLLDRPLALFPTFDPMWRWGGAHCGDGCRATDTKRCIHLVGNIE